MENLENFFNSLSVFQPGFCFFLFDSWRKFNSKMEMFWAYKEKVIRKNKVNTDKNLSIKFFIIAFNFNNNNYLCDNSITNASNNTLLSPSEILYKVVYHLRTCRAACVQTVEQFRFIAEFIHYLLANNNT